jgi:aryl-alcohol dehydrogenase-like predicted oxidoreductase
MTGSERLALGCAQLGMQYGVANTAGQPDPAAAREIVRTCLAAGVQFFDTAQAYGDSEQVLGDALKGVSAARVISKLLPDAAPAPQKIRDCTRESLDRLGTKSLWGLLLHDENQLDNWDRGIGEGFQSLQALGLVKHLGVSVYSPERALEAVECRDIDMVQLPGNIFDRRPIRSGVLRRAQELGKRVFIRSVYLKGLAVLSPGDLPCWLDFARKPLMAYANFCDDHGIDRNRFALSYARDRFAPAVLVIGAETPEQARENCRLMSAPGFAADLYDEWDARWPDDVDKLVNPSKWSR